MLLCFSCLSSDRKFIPLIKVKYRQILRDVGIMFNADVDMICWECAAMVRRLHIFTQQALTAQQTLILHKRLNMLTKIQSISPLRKTTITKLDRVIVYDETKDTSEKSSNYTSRNTNRLKPDKDTPLDLPSQPAVSVTPIFSNFDNLPIKLEVDVAMSEHTAGKSDLETTELHNEVILKYEEVYFDDDLYENSGDVSVIGDDGTAIDFKPRVDNQETNAVFEPTKQTYRQRFSDNSNTKEITDTDPSMMINEKLSDTNDNIELPNTSKNVDYNSDIEDDIITLNYIDENYTNYDKDHTNKGALQELEGRHNKENSTDYVEKDLAINKKAFLELKIKDRDNKKNKGDAKRKKSLPETIETEMLDSVTQDLIDNENQINNEISLESENRQNNADSKGKHSDEAETENLDQNFEVDSDDLDSEDDFNALNRTLGNYDMDYIESHSNIKEFSFEELIEYREKKKNCPDFKKRLLKCETCVEEFRLQKSYDKHMKIHKSERYYKFECSICTRKLMSRQLLDEHYCNHFRRFDCRVCKFVTFDSFTSNYHYKTFHEIKPSICEICNITFETKHLYYNHKRRRHNQKNKQCPECGIMLSNMQSLNQHMLLHSGMPELECSICHKNYRGKWGLWKHEYDVHRDKTKRNRRIEIKTTHCAECNTTYQSEYLYRKHLRNSLKHNSEQDFKHQCPYCSKRFLLKSYLRNHVDKYHETIAKYKCDECDLAFKTMQAKTKHCRVHKIDAKEFYCDICNKLFMKKGNLTRHLRIHFKKKTYSCEICQDMFTSYEARSKHIKSKHDVKTDKNKSSDN